MNKDCPILVFSLCDIVACLSAFTNNVLWLTKLPVAVKSVCFSFVSPSCVTVKMKFSQLRLTLMLSDLSDKNL